MAPVYVSGTSWHCVNWVIRSFPKWIFFRTTIYNGGLIFYLPFKALKKISNHTTLSRNDIVTQKILCRLVRDSLVLCKILWPLGVSSWDCMTETNCLGSIVLGLWDIGIGMWLWGGGIWFVSYLNFGIIIKPWYSMTFGLKSGDLKLWDYVVGLENTEKLPGFFFFCSSIYHLSWIY